MSDCTISVNYMKLILIFWFLSFAKSRHVTNGGGFSNFVLRLSSDDLEVAAAEPRPVIIENGPEVLPLIADQNTFSDSPISLASEKVEKVLQRPLAFSYHDDDRSGAALVVSNKEGSEADVKEIDQKPAAVDYYKHQKNIESTERDEGAGNEQSEDEEEKNSDDVNEKSSEDVNEKSSQEVNETSSEDVNEKSSEEVNGKSSEEVNAETSDHAAIENNDDAASEYNSAEDSDSKSEQYKVYEHHGGESNLGGGHGDGGSHSGGQDGKKESNGGGHGGEGGGGGKSGGGHDEGGGNGSFHKGGGQKHYSGHKGEGGEKGEKGYEGHHHNEKGEKGHHTKEKHAKDYEEKGGEKKEHHHDDGYHAEHGQSEKGEKASNFKEYGDHSKGHSTKGEHSIHKKDEYEKKQEFYDEDEDEDEFEKDGDFYHEDDYSKGGYEKGSFDKGAEEDIHYGKKHEHAKGDHYKEESGYKDAEGHDTHHDHVEKHGEKETDAGGKKWSHSTGTGGDGKGGGKYQHADESNVPIQIVRPDQILSSQNVAELSLDEKKKDIDVLYPPLFGPSPEVNEPVSLIKVSYEDGNPVVPILAPIQKRSDGNDDGKEQAEQEKTASTTINLDLQRDTLQDHKSIIDSLFTEPDTTDGVSSEEDIEAPFEEKAESNVQYENLSPEGSGDELGAYSIYKLGNYSSPKPTNAPKEHRQTQSSDGRFNSSTKDGGNTINRDESKQIETVSTSMKPIVVVEDEP